MNVVHKIGTTRTPCEDPDAGANPVPGWRAVVPAAQWLSGYQGRWLKADLIAGMTLAAYAIPASEA